MWEYKVYELHQQAHRTALSWYMRKGFVPPLLTEIIIATSSYKAFEKYNPDWQNQPRVPAGQPDGGQWTDGGGIENNPARVIDDPPLESVYPIEYLAVGLAGLTAHGVRAAVNLVLGVGQSINSSLKIRRAAKAIEDYLGGKPENKRITNEAGDIFLIRENKKIRFDINNPGNDKPHFHIETKPARGGKWPDSGSQHRYYFRDKE